MATCHNLSTTATSPGSTQTSRRRLTTSQWMHSQTDSAGASIRARQLFPKRSWQSSLNGSAEFIERVSKLSNSANTLLFTGLTLQSMGRSGHLCDPYGLPSLFTVQPPLAETAQRQRTYYQNSLLSALLLKQCTQLKTIIKTQCPDTFLLSC